MADLSLRNPLIWLISFTFFLLSLGFLGFSSLLLTSIPLIISMLYFSIAKRNSFPIEKFIEEEEKEVTFVSDRQSSPAAGGLLSEGECADDNFTTTEDSVVEWRVFDRFMAKTLDQSDEGSISDEESLIEISLPTGHYVSHEFEDEEEEEEDDMSSCYQELPEFEKQRKNLMELLAEINDINEEENLIEIDISMGSIKYSRFEIEARK